MTVPTMVNGGSGAWPSGTPTDLGGTVWWTNQTFDADPIGQWDDEEGTNHLTEATNKPDQDNTDFSYTGAGFNGTDDELSLTSNITCAGDFMMGAAIYIDTLKNFSTIFGGSTSGHYLVVRADGSVRLRIASVNKDIGAASTISPATAYRLITYRSGSNLGCIVDGVDVTVAQTSASSLVIANVGIQLTANWFNGTIGRPLIWQDYDANQVANIDNWLAGV